MTLKISFRKYWEENYILLLIALGFIELLSEQIHDILKAPMAFLGVVLFVANLTIHKKARKKAWIVMLVLILVGVELMIPNGVLVTQYMWDLTICLPIALGVYCLKNVSLKKWIILYLCVTLFLMMRLLISSDHYTIFYNHSRNYISVFVLFLFFLITIIADKEQKKVPGYLYYLTAAVCALAIGRGGVVAGFLVLVMYLLKQVYIERSPNNRAIKLVLLLSAVVFVCLIFVLFQDQIINRFFPRFSGAGLGAEGANSAVSKRLSMWTTYMSFCRQSAKNFLLGADPYPIAQQVFNQNSFNLHNSYLLTHAFYGLLGILSLFFTGFQFLRKALHEKRFDICILFLGFFLRAFTDYCFPGCLSGIAMWIIIFYGTDRYKETGKMRPCLKP